MKTTSSLLLALALLNTAQAGLINEPLSVNPNAPTQPVNAPHNPLILQGLITDPLGVANQQYAVLPPSGSEGFRPRAVTGEPLEPRQTENGGHAVQVPVDYRSDSGMLPLNVDEMGEPVGYRQLEEGFIPSVVQNGYRETRFPDDESQLVIRAESPDRLPLDEMLPIILDENGVPVTRHFSEGAEVMDWIVGLIGNLSTDSTLRLSDLMMNPAVHAALHAPGPEGDELRGYMDWLIMTGLVIGFDGMDGSDDLYGNQGDDELADQAPEGIILGGPGGDTLAGDSQDHNPDVFND